MSKNNNFVDAYDLFGIPKKENISAAIMATNKPTTETNSTSSGSTHEGGGRSFSSGNRNGASNQAKTTAGRSRYASPSPKPESTNPRATKKDIVIENKQSTLYLTAMLR